jgi:hypothetical protein
VRLVQAGLLAYLYPWLTFPSRSIGKVVLLSPCLGTSARGSTTLIFGGTGLQRRVRSRLSRDSPFRLGGFAEANKPILKHVQHTFGHLNTTSNYNLSVKQNVKSIESLSIFSLISLYFPLKPGLVLVHRDSPALWQ